MATKLIVAAASLAVISVVLALLYPPARLSLPPSIPGSRDHLHSSRILHVDGAFGPESLAFDPNGGGPYTGVADGRILRWDGDGRGWVDFAVTSPNRKDCVRPFAPELEHICGRPLGLRFDKKTGDLYIADAYFGLLVVGSAGGLAAPVVTEAESHSFHFTNDMDIDEFEDVIYLTDSSTRFYRRQFMSSILSGDRTGKLMKYDKSSKQLTVLLRDLAFANGVALSKDRSFVLVAESTSCRITRLWLQGPNAGKSDTFAELPGFPDNIRRNPDGEFWVALHSKKGTFARWALSNTFIGNLLLKFPLSFRQLHSMFVGRPHATILRLNEEGEVLEVLEDVEAKGLRFPSEVEERDGKLWIGSVMTPFIGIYNRN
ncbi:protein STRICTOSIDINE SYNTHASE-LIKE 10 [Punica granatum]|uniref:Strictosidine synthase conserved region domain-containing protein n=2 Tax=Punica granatum TaxID=22663 RepID=A0A218XKI3_PUNGR|nr:protein STRICTOSIDINE SYNTHASE-LIKE 10 [Punica granatum]OWM85467.1 hypothetical protein CDL15_Pgr019091 [Punica granatum]PKI50864.1 hypothetical protein CRG98_028771 [Punica granatum]